MVRLHMIGNAHIDPVWLWRWPEGCAEAIGTCWAAIDRLETDKGFIFTRGEAAIYQWIEDLDPPLFERIRHFVREGRWVIVNGWWLQPDCNLPSGESMIRQALYGKRYFRDRFGVEVSVGYNVDSFGHAATLPMLLRHTGSDAYVFMRPGPHEMTLPGELFDWISPDGSRVRAFRIQTAYNTSPRNMPLDEKIDRHVELGNTAGHPFMCFYGVGNHGGGPTRENLAHINRLVAAGEPVAFSDPNRFFASLGELPLPAVTTELQFHAIGCYAAGSSLKALNRRAEALLEQAEAAAAIATRHAGAPYPRAAFEALWRKLLFNQFHDTFGGTTIESAYVDAERDFGAVIAGADEQLNAAARHLGRTIRPVDDAGAATLLAMNFNGTDFDGIVEAEPWTDFDAASQRQLLDEEARPVPFQQIAPEGKTRGLQRIAFRATVPAFGYRLYSFARHPRPSQGFVPPDVSAGAPLPRDALTFETDGWRLAIDPATGAIARLDNRAGGFSVFAGPAHEAIIVDDATDTWSHGVDRFGFDGAAMELEGASVIERGSLRLAVEVTVRHGDSRMATTVVLPEAADLPVELRVALDWREHHRLLRLAYPFGPARFEYEVPAGWTERPDDGREVFGHRWVRAERKATTVAIVNDAKYSYAARDGTLYMTAARAPVFAHHDPIKLRPGASYRFMDQGEQRFTIFVQAARRLSRQDAAVVADRLLKPPVVSPHVARGGTGAWQGSWLSFKTGSATITALKGSEDGKATIVRAVELEGTAARLAFGDATLAVPARGMLTARIEDNRLKESDGLER